MKAIIKREFKNYLKNPILWIGIIFITFSIYQSVGPYLYIHYFNSDEELKLQTVDNLSDADIMQGYIPSTKEQQMKLGYEEIKRLFIEEFDKSQEEAEIIVNEIQNKNMSISEISKYLEETYRFYNGDYIFEDSKFHKGSKEEVNNYIATKLEEKPYSYYFARKFADFSGLFMGFFSTILLAFLFIYDTRKDNYELLHTKPFSGVAYICGKVGGGLAIILFVLVILNVVFGLLCEVFARRAGFTVRYWDIIVATLIYIVPNMLMIICVYAAAALLFKNPLPATPLLFLYLIYSNMGSLGADGRWGYYGRPLAIMVRFPGRFFETTPPPMILLNQIFLIIASILLIMLAVILWKRRRVY